jgi:hypothetical protein
MGVVKAPLFNDAITAATFCADVNNSRALWNPVGGLSANATLPCLHHFPAEVRAFIVKEPHTPWEVHKFFGEMVTQTEKQVQKGSVNLML